jgi:adenosine kinase
MVDRPSRDRETARAEEAMAVLVSGSVAIDHIMVFRGRFKDLILPQHVHALNVAFHVPELRRTWGGCAANIAYHLRLLGDEPLVLATVGSDFADYAAWLDRLGIRRDWIRSLDGEATAGAYITTDLDDNQITGFHPGAMDRAHEVRVEDVRAPFELGIVSPNGKRAMVEHARSLKARGVPTIVDPGQGLPILERDELCEMIEGAAVYIVNDYEWSLTLERSGLNGDAVASRAGAVIVTQGERGSLLRRGGDVVEIPAVAAEQVVDPTGAGDAYRAGLLHGLARGEPLEHGARIGSLLGALQVAHPGTQNLPLEMPAFRARFEREFGTPL